MTKEIKRLLNKDSWPYLFIFTASMTANVFSFAYNMLLNRVLTLDQFSQVGSILNSFIISSGFAMALQYAATKYMPTTDGNLLGKTKPFLNTQITLSLIIGTVMTVLTAITIPLWSTYLHLNLKPQIYLMLSSTFIVFMVLASFRGFLLGKQWYYAAGITLLTENVSKFLFIIIGLLVASPFIASFIAIPTAMVCALIVALILLNQKISWRYQPALHSDWTHKIARFAAYSLLLTMSAQLLLFTDVILVRHYFSGQSAGVYSTLSLIGKIIYFFITSILMIVAPEVSVRQAAHKASHSILVKSALFAAVVGAMSTLVLKLIPQLTLNLVLDPAKVAAALPYIIPYGLAATLISIVVVMSTYYLFSGYKRFTLLIFIALQFQILLIHLFHQQLLQVITIMILISAVLSVAIPIFIKFETKTRLLPLLSPQKLQDSDAISP